MKLASAFAGAALAAAFCATLSLFLALAPPRDIGLVALGVPLGLFGGRIALHCARLLVMTAGADFLSACALVDAMRTREAAMVARIAATAAVATAALLAVAGPSYAGAAAADCLPLGGEALAAAPAWLPAPLQSLWGELFTVPLAMWLLAHLRALVPNDPRLAMILGVVDRLVGNYGAARNGAASR
jgi:hypothetical protein